MNALSRLILLAVAATGSWLFAAEPPAATSTPTPTAAEKPVASDDAVDKEKAEPSAADKEKSDADKDATSKGSAAKGSPQRFIPSEQVRADFDVSFPVDI